MDFCPERTRRAKAGLATGLFFYLSMTLSFSHKWSDEPNQKTKCYLKFPPTTHRCLLRNFSLGTWPLPLAQRQPSSSDRSLKEKGSYRDALMQQNPGNLAGVLHPQKKWFSLRLIQVASLFFSTASELHTFGKNPPVLKYDILEIVTTGHTPSHFLDNISIKLCMCGQLALWWLEDCRGISQSTFHNGHHTKEGPF